MRLGHHELNKTIDEHQIEMADIVKDPKTLVFIDTNILAYLYKLHSTARNEFFYWSDSIIGEKRLFLPGWAANEYLNRVTTNKLDSYTHKSKEPSQAKKAYEALYETASLFVDDDLLKKISFQGNRTEFLEGFRNTIDSLEQYTCAFKQQFKPGDIHAEITNHFSEVVLESDLANLCLRASKEGDVRFEHRLPPGFQDNGKGENRFGDLIIWFEILSKSVDTKGTFDKVLFITNDEKSDWVYAPKMRAVLAAGNRKLIGNNKPEIKIADPRLVSEFSQKVGHSNFSICSLATLVESLSKGDPTRFTHLAGAIQIDIQETEEVVAEDVVEAGPEDVAEAGAEDAVEVVAEDVVEVVAEDVVEAGAEDAVEAEPENPAYVYDEEALQDRNYQVDAPSEINNIIRDLMSHNWYSQNPAIYKISTLRDQQLSPSSCFVLGRNIYQAACGNSQKAMEYIASLHRRLAIFPQETAQHILSGMLYEVYFDSNSEFRNKAKFDYADKLLSLITEEPYLEAKTFIRSHLHAHRERLLFIPGDTEMKKVEIVTEPAENEQGEPTLILQSVLLDGTELIIDGVDYFAETTFDLGEVRLTISEAFAIPKWALTCELKPKPPYVAKFELPEGKLLKPEQA
ncbi:PIN-like domain-containing protein [Shewanella sp. UCD-KL12]|uniref:PIN-like domain-containing protein n=1 Tax=Shewanella sp. UCD-KL12 TaxID=1917163 RepID=UPI000970963B|nr:PIN-like domain-containing protein [Shewanella sp. UCD-KL12]